MTLVNAQNLPWYLIGVLVSALVAVFYSLLRGKVLSSRVADLLRESAEKRAEIAEAGVAANTESVKSLVDSVGKLMVLAENQDKVLNAMHQRAGRGDSRNRGGTS
jgi:cell division protein FtsB